MIDSITQSDQITLLESQNQRLINRNRALQRQLENTRNQTKGDQAQRLPQDVRPQRHHFGAKFIAMCCELSKSVGFRSTQRVLESVREWLEVDFGIPDWTTIRSWLCRMGVAVLDEKSKQANDWIWLADHSIQLGDMKVFVILGIRQRDLPQGRALQRTDMSPLAIIPSTHRDVTV